MIVCSRSLLLLTLLGLSKICCLPSSDSIYDSVKEFEKLRCGTWTVYQDNGGEVSRLKSYNYFADSFDGTGCKGLSIYYPQIGFGSYQLPQCFRDKDTNEYIWMITVRDADSWQRRRVRFESLYCRLDTEKKQPIQGACLPLLPSMTACPAKTPGSGACGKPRMSMTGYFECDPGLELHYTPDRRIPMVPVESVACNASDGEYVVTMRNNQSVKGFTDETWLICKEEQFRPIFKEYDHKELRRNPWKKFFIGGCFGTLVYLIIMLILIGTGAAIYFSVKALIRFLKARAEEKRIKEEEEKKKKATEGTTLSFDQNLPTKGKPKKLSLKAAFAGKKKQPPPPIQRSHPASETPFVMPVQPKFPTDRKPPSSLDDFNPLLMKKRLHEDGNDELTCVEPNLDERDILREQERLAEATDEDDMTGKEVKDIEKED